jgi:hypothetical protein
LVSQIVVAGTFPRRSGKNLVTNGPEKCTDHVVIDRLTG